MTTISSLIVADKSDKRTVSVFPYIPGEQVMIYISITTGDGVIYTIPENYVFLVAFLAIGQTSSAGSKYIHFVNALNADILRPLTSMQSSAGYNSPVTCFFNPMVQLNYGDVIKGYSGGVGVATDFSLVGYLIPVWNGA